MRQNGGTSVGGIVRKTLTDSAIKALQPGQVVNDAVVTGLHVKCTSTGTKSFYLFYRTKLRDARRPRLGDTTVLTIAQARQMARDILAVVADGRDPAAELDKLRGEPTLQEFWDKEVWPHHYSRTKDARNAQRIFNVRIAPRLGNKRMRDIGYADVAILHRDLEAIPYEANRTLALMSKVLTLAERPTDNGRHGLRDIGSNPCGLVARYPELSRRRFATPAELAVIGRTLDAFYGAAVEALNDTGSMASCYKSINKRTMASVTFIGLMIFTGMRPGEVAAATRSAVERLPKGAGILRLPDSKTGQRDVYVPPQAMALIDRLPAPADGTLTGIKYPTNTWDHIRDAAGCRKTLRLYDLRRTFATVSLAGGHSISLIGTVLGHKTAQTTKVYARLMDDAAHGLAGATGDSMQKLLGAST